MRRRGRQGGVRGSQAGTLGLCIMALFLQGCALSFKAPTVRVAEVRLASMDFTGGELRVSLDIQNPNGYALESKDFQYQVEIAEDDAGDGAWTSLAEGRVAEPIRVEGGATERVDIDVPFNVRTVGVALGRLLRRGELEYRFTGVLQAGTPLGTRRIPFDQRGLFRP